MFGFMIGTLAVAWGSLIAFLDQADPPAGRRVDRLCAALLIGCVALTAAGGVIAVMDH